LLPGKLFIDALLPRLVGVRGKAGLILSGEGDGGLRKLMVRGILGGAVEVVVIEKLPMVPWLDIEIRDSVFDFNVFFFIAEATIEPPCISSDASIDIESKSIRGFFFDFLSLVSYESCDKDAFLQLPSASFLGVRVDRLGIVLEKSSNSFVIILKWRLFPRVHMTLFEFSIK